MGRSTAFHNFLDCQLVKFRWGYVKYLKQLREICGNYTHIHTTDIHMHTHSILHTGLPCIHWDDTQVEVDGTGEWGLWNRNLKNGGRWLNQSALCHQTKHFRLGGAFWVLFFNSWEAHFEVATHLNHLELQSNICDSNQSTPRLQLTCLPNSGICYSQAEILIYWYKRNSRTEGGEC